MDNDLLCQKARDIHAAASHPAMQDVLFLDSIRAEWNDKLQTFRTVSISGVKRHRMYPNQTKRFTIHFMPGDPTDMLSIHKRVADRIAKLDRTGKERRLPKRG